MVNSVVSVVLLEVCSLQEATAQPRVDIRKHTPFFYTDDGIIAVQKPIWVQKILIVIVRMFERVGL